MSQSGKRPATEQAGGEGQAAWLTDLKDFISQNQQESEQRIVDSLGARIASVEDRQTDLEKRVTGLETHKNRADGSGIGL